MRTWGRALVACRCGLCGQKIARGEPVLRIGVPSLTRVLLRGGCCVQAPPDLPPLVERVPIATPPLVHLRPGPHALPFDFKSAAAGEREPGQEG